MGVALKLIYILKISIFNNADANGSATTSSEYSINTGRRHGNSQKSSTLIKCMRDGSEVSDNVLIYFCDFPIKQFFTAAYGIKKNTMCLRFISDAMAAFFEMLVSA